jgi:MFS family permease
LSFTLEPEAIPDHGEVVVQDQQQGGLPVPLRRNSGFKWFLSGSSVSLLGSRVTTIAYPLLALAISGSPLVAGWACFAATAPSVLVYLPAGAIIDRCNPRVAMLVCEVVRGLAIVSVVAALGMSRLTVPLLITAAVVEEIFEVFANLAERRLTCSLVEPGDVPSALAGTEARTHLAVMLGRPLGALLFGLSHIAPFAFDSATFGVNAATLLKMRKHYRYDRDTRPSKAALGREIREGLSWLRQDKFALIALHLTAGTTFVGQALIMFFLIQAHAQHLSAIEIGMVLAASGMGGALGALTAPWLSGRLANGLLNWQLAGWLITFTCLYLWGWQSVRCIAAAMMVMSLTGAWGNVALDNYIAKAAGPALLGRVMSIYALISFGALALGPLFGATLLSNNSPRDAVLVLLVTVLILWAMQPHQSHRKTRDGYGAMFCRPQAVRIALSLGRLLVARNGAPAAGPSGRPEFAGVRDKPGRSLPP